MSCDYCNAEDTELEYRQTRNAGEVRVCKDREACDRREEAAAKKIEAQISAGELPEGARR